MVGATALGRHTLEGERASAMPEDGASAGVAYSHRWPACRRRAHKRHPYRQQSCPRAVIPCSLAAPTKGLLWATALIGALAATDHPCRWPGRGWLPL
ncbi:hypothetical protein B296_00045098 [Ensete ventricosum]|uniref:Uncharacterized protein n=1 Tax=Ensete ventricosum TaxID=4639 RepID=A0A426Z8J2_ENSVE|nr:hypothetical protein B296_00045098 [Ensete ventricosum]